MFGLGKTCLPNFWYTAYGRKTCVCDALGAQIGAPLQKRLWLLAYRLASDHFFFAFAILEAILGVEDTFAQAQADGRVARTG